MRLVEQHTIKPSSVYYNELYDLLHKCKNLYNKGLYVVRQHYFQYKDDNTVKYKYLNYYSLEKKLRTENDVDYRALPAPVAQQVLMMVEESYTSKCSFLDNERICKHESYKGRRTKRGLFKTSSGKTINADINGAFNIIRKSEKESFDVTMLPEGRGFWCNPVRISV